MTVTVYVSWETHEILTKEQFEEEVKSLLENIRDDKYEYDERLCAFLEGKEIDQIDLFHMAEIDRKALHKEFDEWIIEDARVQLLEEHFEETELNI